MSFTPGNDKDPPPLEGRTREGSYFSSKNQNQNLTLALQGEPSPLGEGMKADSSSSTANQCLSFGVDLIFRQL
ncbi:MAG: hypothetical protein A2145_06340 [candidate division Zixibacteria bacterium RBG_16_40_9]|nr:MAG: hypothetical protein A2145_06340 [candidate division Zixibacteria bacterium RBG_16_40_9]